jgi:hypothetical protein
MQRREVMSSLLAFLGARSAAPSSKKVISKSSTRCEVIEYASGGVAPVTHPHESQSQGETQQGET